MKTYFKIAPIALLVLAGMTFVKFSGIVCWLDTAALILGALSIYALGTKSK